MDSIDDLVFICYIGASLNILVKVNTTTQDVVKVYKTDTANPIVYGIVVKNGYINLNTGIYDGGILYMVHDQVPSTLDYDGLPNLDENSSYTFSITTDSSFVYSSYSLANYSIVPFVTSNYSSIVSTNENILIYESGSYILSIPDNFSDNILISSSESVVLNISLPCSIDLFHNLTYSIYDNGVDPILSWVTPNYTDSTLSIQAPNISQTTEYKFMIETTYPDGAAISYFYISVEP